MNGVVVKPVEVNGTWILHPRRGPLRWRNVCLVSVVRLWDKYCWMRVWRKLGGGGEEEE
jgi:hypothetical protein